MWDARVGSLKHVGVRKTMRKIGTGTLGVPLVTPNGRPRI